MCERADRFDQICIALLYLPSYFPILTGDSLFASLCDLHMAAQYGRVCYKLRKVCYVLRKVCLHGFVLSQLVPCDSAADL